MKTVDENPRNVEGEKTANAGIRRLIDPVEQQMRRTGVDAAAVKTVLSKLLLSTGIEDNDHLYFDGECDVSPPHRQYAKRLAKEVADCAPDSPDVLDELGMSLIKSGEYQRALYCYRKQADLTPRSGYAENNIAWCQLRLGNAEEAMTACQQALARLGDHSYIHHDHAAILFRLGKLDQALPVLENAIRNLEPKAPQLYYLKACILEKQGKKMESVATWKAYCKAVKSHRGHHRAAERGLARLEGLGHGRSRWRRNRLLAKIRPQQISVKPLWEFVGLELANEQRFRPSGDRCQSDMAARAAKKGWKLLQRGQRSPARRKCDEALRIWPFSGVGRVLRARLALQEKDYETYARYVTLANLEQVVGPVGEPRCRALAEFVFLMILVNAEKAYHDGDFDSALTQLDEAYRHYPKDPMVVFLRGLILAAKGEKKKASALTSALRGDPQAVDALMRACRDEIPRMSASASSPLSNGPRV